MTRERTPEEEDAGEGNDVREEAGTRRLVRGAAVLVVLHTPRERCWGVLDEISAAGVFLRGLDLNAFDDFVRGVASGEPSLGPSEVFFPMWRVERVALDERAGDVPSLAEQFESRTGRMLREFF